MPQSIPQGAMSFAFNVSFITPLTTFYGVYASKISLTALGFGLRIKLLGAKGNIVLFAVSSIYSHFAFRFAVALTYQTST